MNKSEIINYALSDKYKSICLRLAGNLSDDLHQEFLLILLEFSDEKIADIRQPDAFLYRILKNMACSSTSKFYEVYRRQLTKDDIRNIKEKESPQPNYKKFSIAFDSLYWYDKEILKLYESSGSVSKIKEKVNIPETSLKVTIRNARKEIKKRMDKLPIKILLPVQYNITGLEYHRQIMPFERLIKMNPGVYDVQMLRGVVENQKVYEPPVDTLPDDVLEKFSIVYFLRQVSHDINKTQPIIDRMKKFGIKIVLDIDDYWHLPKEHYWHQKYKEQNVMQNTITAISQADAIVTTTGTFKDYISEYNNNVTILPNCINTDEEQFISTPTTSPLVRFGWVGGVFHKPDLAILAKSLQKVYSAPDISGKFQICFGGFNPNHEFMEIERILTNNYCFKNYDKGYFNYLCQLTQAMEHYSFSKPYRRLWGRDVNSYGKIYNDIDVALVPLLDNPFNSCKSELKIVEAGWMGKAVICSDVAPYNKWIKNGVNGILISHERNHIDWFVAMRKLIHNPQMRIDMAGELTKTIKENFDMDTHNTKRDGLLKSLAL